MGSQNMLNSKNAKPELTDCFRDGRWPLTAVAILESQVHAIKWAIIAQFR
jgi:hypothetical protein